MNRSSHTELQALTAPQLEMWFAQQLAPENPRFDVCFYLEIHGPVDTVVFGQALQQFLSEAEALHLRFVDTAGGPMRKLIGPPLLSFDCVDLSGDAAPFQAALHAMRVDASTVFDLAEGPLFKYALFKLDSQHFLWYQRYHHIALDGASIPLATHRVGAIYSALMRERPIAAANFATLDVLLQNDAAYRRSARYASDRGYWRDYVAELAGATTMTGGPPDTGGLFRRRSIELSQSLTAALAAAETPFCKWPQLFTAIVAAYMLRMANLGSGVFDFPIAARAKDTRATPGMFANVVPLKVSMSTDDTLATLTQRVDSEIFRHLKHQYFRGKDIRHMLGAAAAPIFGPRINIVPLDDSWRFDGYPATLHALSNGLVNDFAVTVMGRPGSPGFVLHVDANTNLYDDASVAAHGRRLRQFIESVLADPQQPLSRIGLLGHDERRLLLDTWNATSRPYPDQLCIHQLVQRQADRHPDAVAIRVGNESLSYATLDAHANQLARHLLDLGVAPETRVALCAQRTPALVVAMLAIVKAGGAYVPLDPVSPGSRLVHIVQDAAPAMLIADRAGCSAFGDLLPSTLPLINLDAETPCWAEQSKSPLRLDGREATGLAYVIYTSGSTGLPKGVMVEHRQLVNLVCWHIGRFGLRPGCASTATAGLAFDATAWEIWPVLASGATLLLPPPGLADPAAMLHWWRDQPVDTAFLVTPLALLAIDAGLPRRLRRLLVGGDRLAQRPAALPEAVELVNNYGPTETTVVATSGIVSSGDTVPTIGKPIANTRIYLLDAQYEPVPLGAVGELYIGGAGVARGYLNQPELTAQRFLRDPFAGAPDARMYRTGDLARYLPDGNLVFLGRNDEQMKIRGFRIEPGEIEVQLATHPEVREAVVLARVDQPGEARLVGYVTLHDGATAGTGLPGVLRAHLERRLPDYMVPSAFVHLERLPLTPNGKLDRKALPAPLDDAFSLEQYAAPQGEIETMLATLWQAFLGIERVGRHDNFFALGGHSLMAARLLNQVRVTFGRDVSLGALFEAPSIALFAERLEAHAVPRQDFGALNVLLPLRTQGQHPPLFCIHPGGGFGWPYAGLLRFLPDRPLYALQARRLSEPTRRFDTIETIAADYLEQIRSVQPTGPYRLLGWSLGCHIAHAVATLLQHQNERVEQLIMFDSYPIPPAVEMPLPPTDLQIAKVLFQSLSDTPWEDADMPSSPDAIRQQLSRGRESVHGLGDEVFNAIFDELKATPALICQFRPGVFDGDLLFFRATRTEPDNALLGESTAWQPYIGGHIVTHDIACLHEKMLHPEALALIGPLVAAALR